MIDVAAVVVPAHNEEALLAGCLAAVRRAAVRCGIPVHVVVVADACTDRTAALATEAGAQVVHIEARSVGAARAAGFAEATTDADTIVPPAWLRRQARYAARGFDLVLGTVTVRHWAGHPPHVAVAFAERYHSGPGPHPHVHGANLGIGASAYRAAGGFRDLRTAEDHALLAAATQAGCRILRAGDVSVETSARRHARAPDGFSGFLLALGGRSA